MDPFLFSFLIFISWIPLSGIIQEILSIFYLFIPECKFISMGTLSYPLVYPQLFPGRGRAGIIVINPLFSIKNQQAMSNIEKSLNNSMSISYQIIPVETTKIVERFPVGSRDWERKGIKQERAVFYYKPCNVF